MNIFNRVIKAAMLDVAFYNEVESDTSLNNEALLVVIIASIASAIGGFIERLFAVEIGTALLVFFILALLGVVNYYFWAYITYFVGTNLFEGRADTGELLRVLGYANGPQILSIFSFVPCLGAMLSFVGGVWSLIAGFIGVRESLDLGTGKTIVTVIVGWIIILLLNMLIGLILGLGSSGLGVTSSILSR